MMPAAVPSLFASNLSTTQASAPKAPLLAQPLDGQSSSFKNVLDQQSAKQPSSDQTPSISSAADAKSKPAQADSTNQKTTKSSETTKARHTRKKQKASPQDDAAPADAESPDAAPQVDAAPQLPSDASTVDPKIAREISKLAEKSAPDATKTDPAEQQAAAAAGPLQPVDPKIATENLKKQEGGEKAKQAVSVKPVTAPSQDSPAAPDTGTDEAQTDEVQQAAAKLPGADTQTARKAPAKGKPAKQSESQDPKAQPAIQPSSAKSAQAQKPANTASSDAASQVSATDASATSQANSDDTTTKASASDASDSQSFSDVLSAAQTHNAANGKTAPSNPAGGVANAQAPAAPPEAQFADANHPHIVSGIHGQLLPNGGSMQIRLDPPELGALHVIVRVHEGTMTASFQTSNDEATRLLSHSLTDLKSALESQGMSVGKLHVEQTPRDQQSGSNNPDHHSQDGNAHDHPARQEQQRREMLRRMWRRLTGGNDPLDMVA